MRPPEQLDRPSRRRSPTTWWCSCPTRPLDLDDLERVTDLLGGRDVTPFVDPLEDRPYVIRVIKEPR